MKKLLILADDYTGALDTSVRLSDKGISVRVVGLAQSESALEKCSEDVLSIDMESRHLPPDSAKSLVSGLVRLGIENGFQHFYKKTDSALRGNIGAELAGMLEAVNEKTVKTSECKTTETANNKTAGVTFVPAFPEGGRIVDDGILYINGVPVADSVFGKDPFTPVTRSNVAEIIYEQTFIYAETTGRERYTTTREPFAEQAALYTETIGRDQYTSTDKPFVAQTTINTETIGRDQYASWSEPFAEQAALYTETIGRDQYATLSGPFTVPCIRIVDAKTTDDIAAIGAALKGTGNARFLAGCAGFASVLPDMIDFDKTNTFDTCEADGLFVVSGSLNPVTLSQIERGEEYGFTVFTLSQAQIANPKYPETVDCAELIINISAALSESKRVILRSAASISETGNTHTLKKANVEKNISVIVSRILNNFADCGLAVFGGDTLHAILKEVGVTEVFPIREIEPGTVAALIKTDNKPRLLITKSGGLGSPDVLGKILRYLE